MAVQTKLYSFYNNFGNFRSILTNRITVHNVQPAQFISTETKSKLETVPKKPKRPLTPFLRFSVDRRTDVVKKNPAAKVADVAKILGAEWKTVNVDVKKKYERLYKDDLEVYTKEHLEYLANLTEEQKAVLSEAAKEKKHAKETRKLHQFYKESNKPKGPRPPYVCYLMEQTGAKGGLKEAMAKYKGLWAKLPEAEKQKYVQTSEDERKRYEMEMEVWEAKMIKQGHTDMVRKSTLDDHKPRRPVHRKTSDKAGAK